MIVRQTEMLRRLAIFGALRVDSIELLLDQSTEKRVAAGDHFFREGDTGNAVYVLQSGRVEVVRDWHGESIDLGTLGPGDCFGEMALIDFQPRSASVRAIDDTCSIELPASSVRRLSQEDVEQYAILMMNLGREVSRRLRVADRRLFAMCQTHGETHPSLI